ncbi:hypothetical protein [Tabrizicola sp. TH137]|uniref:hypothetical protein n=1 Tax=Tabrizicola sp. TH137 TaxID=2067452 RepID=UPI00117CD7FD|nr:hypothetical protein [Tabrizicola sp. TH137]
MLRLILWLTALLAAPPVLAQEVDPMAEQRCVWSCLANSPGAESDEYAACVARLCEAMGQVTATEPEGLALSPRPQPRPPQSLPQEAGAVPPPMPETPLEAEGWTFGPGEGGQGMFAGTSDPVTGVRVDWLCGKGRPSVLALSPYAGGARVTVTVDGRVREVDLVIEGEAGYAPIGLSDPLFLHLASGPEFEVADGAGRVIGRFTMAGAPLAIGQAEGRCR